MNISFVIPAYNEEKYLGDCLASILKYGPADAEIIVVDNASTDRTGKIAERFDRVRMIREERKGVTLARQKGLEAARGELVAFIDADCRLTPEWRQNAEKYFAWQNIAAVSGPYKMYDLPAWQQSLLIAPWNYLAWLFSKIIGYAVYGGNLIARRQALRQVGGWNLNIKFYGDDSDIGKKLKQRGKVLFLPRLYVFSSARRLKQEGIFSTGLKYFLNYAWIGLFKKACHETARDIR